MCWRIAHVSTGNVLSILASLARQRREHRHGLAARVHFATAADDQRAAARHRVGLGFAPELARPHGRERARLAPIVALAVRVERAGRQAQAFVRFGLVVAGVGVRPANPALAEHDRAGRHACKYDAAQPPRHAGRATSSASRSDIHTRLDVAAADENEDRRARAPARAAARAAAPPRASATRRPPHPQPSSSAHERRAERRVVAVGGADVERRRRMLARQPMAASRYGRVPKCRLPNWPAISVTGLRKRAPSRRATLPGCPRTITPVPRGSRERLERGQHVGRLREHGRERVAVRFAATYAPSEC